MLFVKGFKKYTFLGMINKIILKESGNDLYIFEQSYKGIHYGSHHRLGPRNGYLLEYILVCPD